MKNKILFAILPVLLAVGLVNAETYISDCQQLGADNETYILTQDIIGTNATTCFDIVGQNITLDCQYHKIISDGTGNTAINLGNDHITVQNCYVDNFTGFSINIGGNYARLINVSVGGGSFSIALGDNAYLKNITSLGGYTDTFIHAVTGRSNVTIDGVYGIAELDVSWFMFFPNSYNITVSNVNVYYPQSPTQRVPGIGFDNSNIVYVSNMHAENLTSVVDVMNTHNAYLTNITGIGSQQYVSPGINIYNSSDVYVESSSLSGFAICLGIDSSHPDYIYRSNFTNCGDGIRLVSSFDNHIYTG